MRRAAIEDIMTIEISRLSRRYGSFAALDTVSLTLRRGEFVVVPRGVEHRPVAEEEAHIMLFEPAGTANTGSAGGEMTTEAERI